MTEFRMEHNPNEEHLENLDKLVQEEELKSLMHGNETSEGVLLRGWGEGQWTEEEDGGRGYHTEFREQLEEAMEAAKETRGLEKRLGQLNLIVENGTSARGGRKGAVMEDFREFEEEIKTRQAKKEAEHARALAQKKAQADRKAREDAEKRAEEEEAEAKLRALQAPLWAPEDITREARELQKLLPELDEAEILEVREAKRRSEADAAARAAAAAAAAASPAARKLPLRKSPEDLEMEAAEARRIAGSPAVRTEAQEEEEYQALLREAREREEAEALDLARGQALSPAEGPGGAAGAGAGDVPDFWGDEMGGGAEDDDAWDTAFESFEGGMARLVGEDIHRLREQMESPQ